MLFGNTMDIKNSSIHKFYRGICKSRQWNVILPPTKVIVHILYHLVHIKPSSITKPCNLSISEKTISAIYDCLSILISYSISCSRPEWLDDIQIYVVLRKHLIFYFLNEIYLELSVIIPAFVVHTFFVTFCIDFFQRGSFETFARIVISIGLFDWHGIGIYMIVHRMIRVTWQLTHSHVLFFKF